MRLRPTDRLRLFLAFLLLASLAGPAAAHERQRLVFFGDSLSDPGNYFIAFHQVSKRPFEPIPSAPYLIGGFHFSNGATWAEQLAWQMGTPASGLPALLLPRVFTNYAVGRARARPGAPVFSAFDLGTQVKNFLRDFRGNAPSDAIYSVWIGGDDLNDALNALADDPSGATSIGIMTAAIGSIAANLQVLWLAGAREFLVPNLPDLALTPAVRALGPQAEAAASLLSQSYNAGLAQALGQVALLPGIHIVPLDIAGLLEQVAADPAAEGLLDATDACLRFGVIQDAICPMPNRFLFWDGIHPTRAGHSIVAREAAEALGAP
jgi:phospholipase/lecithinase/hemolysin